ncbi:PIN2/TERF1-interacting telomerase inhibitor 1 [Pelodytes ibericus]
MAMLAEPRRKQKWSVDPRNSTWSKDESKFGQKMLEKMGWSKGKGLGAKEQGSTDHIKVQVKNNTLGLGAAINHEDNWIAHQDDFNQILAELNKSHSKADSDPAPDNEKKSFSLEEKSKSSKKRVHYMKFAKGKDLSCRTDTDLACIFGKREKTKKTVAEEEHHVDSEKVEVNGSRSPPKNDEPGNTVTSTMSVNEYFAKRMAELKKSQANRMQSTAIECLADSTENPSEDAKRKSKKKKRNKRDGGFSSNCPDNRQALENEDSLSAAECLKSTKKSKNKRTNKELHSEDAVCVGEVGAQASDAGDQDEKPKRRKKKNKRKKAAAPVCNEERGKDCSPCTDEPKKKKKKTQSS